MRLSKPVVRTSLMLLGLLLMTPGLSRPERKKAFVDPLLQRMMRGSLMAQSQGIPRGRLHKDELKLYRKLVAMNADDAEPTVKVRLRLDASARQSIERLGIKTFGRMKDFASAVVPVSRLQEVADVAGVEMMQAVHVPTVELDVSRAEVRSTLLASPPTSGGYGATGKGVILGNVDTGLDWRHQDFRKADGTTRIKYLWVQDQNSCTGPLPPAPFDFGCLYTEAAINSALTGGPAIDAPDAEGHGTNTTGVAAGNGRATGNGFPAGRYVGMAPEADIIMVKTFPEPTDANGCAECFDISAGLDFIDSKAAELGEPYAVNLSLGSQFGGHDGTDLDEQTIDALTGPGIPGKAIVKSAGNDRGHAIHISGTVAAGGTNNHTFTVPSYTPAPSPPFFNDIAAWSMWYSGGDNMTVTILDPTTAPCTSTTALSATTGQGFVSASTTSGVMIVDDTGSPAVNGSRFFEAEIDDQLGNAPCRGVWTFRVHGNTITAGGHYDVWMWLSSYGTGQLESPWAAPDDTRLISIPGTAMNVTTVGAYVTKNHWTAPDGFTYQYNDPTLPPNTPPPVGALAFFSSPGPSRDGRLKPEISAPGWTSLSALSQDAAPINDSRTFAEDGVHWAQIGTSFASPHVAGIFAQLLSLNPNMDAIDLRTVVTQTGRADANTGAVPNNLWGRGKVDAKGAADTMVKSIPDLTASSNKQTFTWGANAFSTTYNVYRGDLSLVSNTYYGSCFATGLASTTFNDVAVPVPGAGFFYYVTGVLGGFEGMLGFRSDGTARPNNSPCP